MAPPSVYCGSAVLAGDTVRGCPGIKFLVCGNPSTTWTGNDGTSKNLFVLDDTGAAVHTKLVGGSVQNAFAASWAPDGSVRYATVDFDGANPVVKIISLSADLATVNWTHTSDRISGVQTFNPRFYGRLVVDKDGGAHVSYTGYDGGVATSFIDRIDAAGSLDWSVEASSGIVVVHDMFDDERVLANVDGDLVVIDADGGGDTTLWSSSLVSYAAVDENGDIGWHTGSGDLHKEEDDETNLWSSDIDSSVSDRPARMVRADEAGDFHVVHAGSTGDNTYRKFRGSDGASIGYTEAGEFPESIALGRSADDVMVGCSRTSTISGGGPTGSHFRFSVGSLLWAFDVPVSNVSGYGAGDIWPRRFRTA